MLQSFRSILTIALLLGVAVANIVDFVLVVNSQNYSENELNKRLLLGGLLLASFCLVIAIVF